MDHNEDLLFEPYDVEEGNLFTVAEIMESWIKSGQLKPVESDEEKPFYVTYVSPKHSSVTKSVSDSKVILMLEDVTLIEQLRSAVSKLPHAHGVLSAITTFQGFSTPTTEVERGKPVRYIHIRLSVGDYREYTIQQRQHMQRPHSEMVISVPIDEKSLSNVTFQFFHPQPERKED